jgi:hypothetical protein
MVSGGVSRACQRAASSIGPRRRLDVAMVLLLLCGMGCSDTPPASLQQGSPLREEILHILSSTHGEGTVTAVVPVLCLGLLTPWSSKQGARR